MWIMITGTPQWRDIIPEMVSIRKSDDLINHKQKA